MFTGIGMLLALTLQIAIVVRIIVYAVKLLNRISEISESQKSIANSQTLLVNLLSNKQEYQQSIDV